MTVGIAKYRRLAGEQPVPSEPAQQHEGHTRLNAGLWQPKLNVIAGSIVYVPWSRTHRTPQATAWPWSGWWHCDAWSRVIGRSGAGSGLAIRRKTMTHVARGPRRPSDGSDPQTGRILDRTSAMATGTIACQNRATANTVMTLPSPARNRRCRGKHLNETSVRIRFPATRSAAWGQTNAAVSASPASRKGHNIRRLTRWGTKKWQRPISTS